MAATSHRTIVVTAILALCISLLVSLYFNHMHKQAKKKVKIEMDNFASAKLRQPPPMDFKSPKRDFHKSRSRKGGWASSLMPYYGFAVIGYIFYAMWKIIHTRRVHKTSNSQKTPKFGWLKKQKPKGNFKTKITMYEIDQLEQRLQETEAAVQQIFEQTNKAVKAVAEVFDEDESEVKDSQESVGFKRDRSISTSDTDSCTQTSRASKNFLRGKRLRKVFKKRAEKQSAMSENEDSSEWDTDNNLSAEEIFSDSSAEISSENCSDSGINAKRDLQDSGPAIKTETLGLLHTANSVKECVSELKSYIEYKKSEHVEDS